MRTIRETTCDPSLVLRLPLYEPEGASFMSRDAYGHLCTATGALWTPQGRLFDGIDDKIVVPHATSLNPSLIAVIVWYKFLSLVANWQGVISKYDASHGWTMQVSDAALPRVELFTTGGAASAISASAISANIWYCMGFDYDGAVIQQYRNGAPDGSPTAKVGTIDSSSSDLWLAYRSDGNFPSNIVIGEAVVLGRPLGALGHNRFYLATKWRYQ